MAVALAVANQVAASTHFHDAPNTCDPFARLPVITTWKLLRCPIDASLTSNADAMPATAPP